MLVSHCVFLTVCFSLCAQDPWGLGPVRVVCFSCSSCPSKLIFPYSLLLSLQRLKSQSRNPGA